MKEIDTDSALFIAYDSIIEENANKKASKYAEASSKLIKKKLVEHIKKALEYKEEYFEKTIYKNIKEKELISEWSENHKNEITKLIFKKTDGNIQEFKKLIWLYMAKYQEMKEMLYVNSGTKKYIISTIKEYGQICKDNNKYPDKKKIKKLAKRAADQFKEQKIAAVAAQRAIPLLGNAIVKFLIWKSFTNK